MDIHTLVRGTPEYPAELLRLDDPPLCVRVRGCLPPRERMIAIVGTRGASERALRFAEELAEKLAQHDCAIVSGGALGIDTRAHEGALRGRGATLIVHASGLQHAYPRENAELFDRAVLGGGGGLSEHPDDAPPLKRNFLARNRLIAALARAVIVIEAPFPSGALSTAHTALKLGVPLLAVPAFPGDANADGSNLLLRLGARPCLSEEDALTQLDNAPATPLPPRLLLGPKKARSSETLSSARPSRAPSAPRRPRSESVASAQSSLALDLPPELASVLQAVGTEHLDLDTLAARTGLAFEVLQARVTELELMGALSLDAAGRFVASARNR